MRLEIQEETNTKHLKVSPSNGTKQLELRIQKHNVSSYILNVSIPTVEVYSKRAVISEITLESILA